ncbi:hypothetical protein MMARJ_17260 [Mycobacterium marseillense]|uniref:Uncharacterized protein n=1 Tax=Mycobacterium marseillense TaxID=701042 RepID=A0ABN5ZQW1_9MYCO|nr:hypothetical protein MMARJ_17260 [Mycobacterium marseillense]
MLAFQFAQAARFPRQPGQPGRGRQQRHHDGGDSSANLARGEAREADCQRHYSGPHEKQTRGFGGIFQSLANPWAAGSLMIERISSRVSHDPFL